MKTALLALLAASAALLAQDAPPGVAGPQTATVALEWDGTPPPDSERVAGYRLYVRAGGVVLAVHDTALETRITVPGLSLGETYAFSVTAYDALGIESRESDPLIVPLGVPVAPPARLRVVEIQVSHDLKEWRPLAFVPVAETDMPLFVRARPTEIAHEESP